MSKRAAALLVTLSVSVGMMGAPSAAAAPAAGAIECDAEEFGGQLESYLEQLTARASTAGATYGDVSASVTPEVLEHYDCDPVRAISDVRAAHSAKPLFSSAPPIIEQPGPIVRPMATALYTAAVWSGIPALGHATVRQDFTATVTSGRIGTVRIEGNSRMTGLSLGTWSHSRSWTVKKSANRHLEVYILGTLSYGIPKTPLTFTTEATFLDFWKGSGGRLVKCGIECG